MVPIDEFNRFTIAADANKLLVPTYPKRKADETQVDYDNRLPEGFIMTYHLSLVSQELLAMHLMVLLKSYKRYSGA